MGTPPAQLDPVRVFRADDLLDLTFSFRNLKLQRPFPGGPVLVRRDAGAEAQLVVTFPPQHVVEKAYFEGAGPGLGLPPNDPDHTSRGDPGDESPDLLPIRSLIAGRSQLVFAVGDQVQICYTVQGLLDAMRMLPLRVVAAARTGTSLVTAAVAPAARRWARLLADAPAGGASAAEISTAVRLLRNTTELATRYGAGVAVAAAAATNPALLGRARREIHPTGSVDNVARTLAAAGVGPLPENPFGPDPRTGVELPFRLVLSPSDDALWSHSSAPVTHPDNDRFELWHTRLGTHGAAGDPGKPPTIQGVWAREFDRAIPVVDQNGKPVLPKEDGSQDDPPKGQMRMALSGYDRVSLVHLTSNHRLSHSGHPVAPLPASVNNLALSTLGGWLDGHGRWDIRPDGLALEEWRHIVTGGRDHYVRVMSAGFLFPFGHRASLVKVTERKFDADRAGHPAYLFQRMFIVVREPTHSYEPTRTLLVDDSDPSQAARRNDQVNLLFPFTTVQLTTLVTPNLKTPEPFPVPGLSTDKDIFFPTVADGLFHFKAVAVDLDGRPVDLRTPLLFISAELNQQGETRQKICRAYDKPPIGVGGDPAGRNTVAMLGQSIAVAPSNRIDDTRCEVSGLDWGADAPSGLQGDYQQVPLFVPRVQHATIVIPAVARLCGKNDPVKVRYAQRYRQKGFTADNSGEVFLELDRSTRTDVDFTQQKDRSGGLAAPNFKVAGLSRKTGPVAADPAVVAADSAATSPPADPLWKVANGTFDPADFFATLDAKLFGAIPLAELIKDLETGFGEPLKVPTFLTQILNSVTMFVQDIERVGTALQPVAHKFPQLQAAITNLSTATTALLQRIGSFVAHGGSTIDEVDTAFHTFSTAFTQVKNVLPAGVDPAVTTLMAWVDQHIQAWDAGSAQVLSIKQALVRAAQGAALPEVVNTRLEWAPDIRPWPFCKKATSTKELQDKAIFWPHGYDKDHPESSKCRFSLVVDLRGSLRPDVAAGADVTCTLEEFDLLLVPEFQGLRLSFKRIRFTARAGAKPDVDVAFCGVEFIGPLAFVQTLRRLIPLDGFSDPPGLDVTPSGIVANYSMGLPNLAVGIFSLENLGLGASLRVPFLGESMEAGFAFCTREQPFRLTVSLFGGGGFFGIIVQPDKVKVLEAALEFGAAVALNFGVASGSVSVMAGIYFRLENGEQVTLAGYFRARGEVDVLGIVSASIEVYLELRYESPPSFAAGRATITLEIDLAFLHKSVEISCERRFAGSTGDPTFAELMAPYTDPVTRDQHDPCREYCTAFAEVS